MGPISYADTLEVLLLIAADDGRGDILFGDSLQRARETLPPFAVGNGFPDLYLEFPLAGQPFLDATVLYAEMAPGTHVDSPLAAGTEAMFDWYAPIRDAYPTVCCGFEVDSKQPQPTPAAIHFQPREYTELVMPFCETIGEQAKGQLYLDLAQRMPSRWPLSFFGMFRGRPDSPLRVCGYLPPDERVACANDPGHLQQAFDAVGFSAYDHEMLQQVSTLLAAVPGSADFQFDVFPDGSLSPVFAIDTQFEIQQPAKVMASFTDGPGARIMKLLESWGIADERWKLGAEMAFAKSIPSQKEDGSIAGYAFTMIPQWAKVRWANKQLQPAKLYCLGRGSFIEPDTEQE